MAHLRAKPHQDLSSGQGLRGLRIALLGAVVALLAGVILGSLIAARVAPRFDLTPRWIAGAGLAPVALRLLLGAFAVCVLLGARTRRLARVLALGVAAVALADLVLGLRPGVTLPRSALLGGMLGLLLVAWSLDPAHRRRGRATPLGPWEKIAQRAVQIRRPV